jgi:hypothetical protein
MKKFIPKRIIDFINWQRIKYINNSKKQRENVILGWSNGSLSGLTPHIIKQEVIKLFQQKYSVETFVETGTFRGEMVYAQRKYFKKIISIELSTQLFDIARKRFKNYSNVEIINGDSAVSLGEIVIKLKTPAIFWLDGHYSGFETAKGDLETPIKKELESILKSDIDHIILIDDARLFIGQNDYPTLEGLKEFILSLKNSLSITVKDDIIRIHKS